MQLGYIQTVGIPVKLKSWQQRLVSSVPFVRLGPAHCCITVKVSGEGWQLQGIVGLQAKNTI